MPIGSGGEMAGDSRAALASKENIFSTSMLISTGESAREAETEESSFFGVGVIPMLDNTRCGDSSASARSSC
jgi:microcompartment protein CcmK/EutM